MKLSQTALDHVRQSLQLLMPNADAEAMDSAMSGATFAIAEYLSAMDVGELRSAVAKLTASQEAHRAIHEACTKASQSIAPHVTPETKKLTEGFLYYLSVIANTADAHLSGNIN